MILYENDKVKYFMDCDDNNYIVHVTRKGVRVRMPKTGEVVIRDSTNIIGYYSSLDHTLKACIRHAVMNGIREEELHTIGDCISLIEEVKSEITEATKGY